MSIIIATWSKILSRDRILKASILRNGCFHIQKKTDKGLFLQNRTFSTTSLMCIQDSKLASPTLIKPLKKYLKYIGICLGIGSAISGAYMFNIYNKINRTLTGSMVPGEEYILKDPPPNLPVARSIQNEADRTGFKITLYQFQTCPFCCKVRAFLDYFGFNYNVVEVNSVTHKETKWTTYRKVPFIVIEQPNSSTILQLKDSSMIISALQSFLYNQTQTFEDIVKCYPTESYMDNGKEKTQITNKYFIMYGQNPPEISEKEIISNRKWRKWVDEVYVHMLSPNVYRTMKESFQAFNWFSKDLILDQNIWILGQNRMMYRMDEGDNPRIIRLANQVGNWEKHFATWERLLAVYVGSVAMYLIGKRLKERHHLKDDVRCSLYEETNYWLKNLKSSGGRFMGGAEPDVSDLCVYGVLTAIEGCDAFEDLLTNTRIQTWFQDMKEAVDSHAGSKYILAKRIQ